MALLARSRPRGFTARTHGTALRPVAAGRIPLVMALPNVLGMYFLARVVAREIKGHRERIDAGVIPQVPEDAQVGMMVVNEATPEQLENADTEYALRAAAQDARSKELQLGHTAPDTERDYLQHLPEDHEIFNTMDREGKPLKDQRHES